MSFIIFGIFAVILLFVLPFFAINEGSKEDNRIARAHDEKCGDRTIRYASSNGKNANNYGCFAIIIGFIILMAITAAIEG